jgi:hypothetical protein
VRVLAQQPVERRAGTALHEPRAIARGDDLARQVVARCVAHAQPPPVAPCTEA